MRRALLTAFAGIWCLTGAVARAQYDTDLERVQVGSPNPEGRPVSYRPWAPLSYYLWHDGAGWHLRATTSGHYHQFSGSVQGLEGVYNVRSSDPSVPLNIQGNAIAFNFGLQGAEKGFDFASNGPVNFNLTIDGRERPEKIRIGYGEQRPYPGPFQVQPGGGPVGPAPVAAVEQGAPEEDAADVQNADGPEMDVDELHTQMTSYGSWVDVPGYGAVWHPGGDVAVAADWSPYSYGHWVYTDLGWTWVSDYNWGWAPYHYGNWVFVDGAWGWIPGRVWAPAWVSWRYGGGYVGWAPCGPVGLSVAYVVQPRYYGYVTVGGFAGTVSIHSNYVYGERAVVIGNQTTVLAGASYVGGHAVVPVNAGPSPHVIGAAMGHPIVPVQAATLHVHPPQGTPGVHYAAGTSAAHPFATHALPAATARQYIAAQPKEAQQHFAESRAVTRGGIQPGKPMPTQAPQRPAARPTQQAMQGQPHPTPRANEPAGRAEERTAPQQREQPQERSEPQQRSEPAEHSEPQQRAEPQERAQPQQQQKPAPQPQKQSRPPPEKKKH